jgi:integrase
MEDVRWREGRIAVVQQKTRRPLSLPLHPAVGRALTEYVERTRPRGTAHREILLTRRRSMPYPNGSSLAHTIAKRIRRLGLRTHPHAFRHAFASRLLNNGCPPVWIQTLLGHQDPSSTEIYAKVDLAKLAEAANNDAGDL